MGQSLGEDSAALQSTLYQKGSSPPSPDSITRLSRLSVCGRLSSQSLAIETDYHGLPHYVNYQEDSLTVRKIAEDTPGLDLASILSEPTATGSNL
jgi:hypothetical protein